MRILVDVCAGYTTRDWLVLQGHDVGFVGDRDFSMDDRDVLGWAHSEGRVLVTCDKDFGHLVAVEQRPHSGILLLPGVVPRRSYSPPNGGHRKARCPARSRCLYHSARGANEGSQAWTMTRRSVAIFSSDGTQTTHARIH